MTDRETSRAIANARIYTHGREWIAYATSSGDGSFTLTGVCASGLSLIARKDGYESTLQKYAVTVGSSVSVVMFKLGE